MKATTNSVAGNTLSTAAIASALKCRVQTVALLSNLLALQEKVTGITAEKKCEMFAAWFAKMVPVVNAARAKGKMPSRRMMKSQAASDGVLCAMFFEDPAWLPA